MLWPPLPLCHWPSRFSEVKEEFCADALAPSAPMPLARRFSVVKEEFCANALAPSAPMPLAQRFSVVKEEFCANALGPLCPYAIVLKIQCGQGRVLC
jgi:hypothetical protein